MREVVQTVTKARGSAQLRMAWAASALMLLAGVLLPGAATAEQASQPTAPVAGYLDVGDHHSCAVHAFTLRCWGYGGDGQLGYGDTRSIGDDDAPASVGPVAFGNGRTVRAISAGNVHTCALLDDATVRCWGFGANGRLGYPNTTGSAGFSAPPGPVDLGEGRTAKAISAGNGHTCAVLDDGTVRCWGFGVDGRLGYGSIDDVGDNETPGSVGPVDLGTDIFGENFGQSHTAKHVAAGGTHTCVIMNNDMVRCWGFGGHGRLGYSNTGDIGREPGRTPNTAGPVNLGTDDRGRKHTAKALALGVGHTCAILDDDSVRCWGLGASGRLGYGNTRNIGDDETPGSVAPVNLGEGRTAKAITAGASHTCALLDNGTVRCWGQNTFGQLGYGHTDSIGEDQVPGSVAPVDLGRERTATAISAGFRHTCARLDDASVRCWGFGANGRLGYCKEATIGDDETPGSAGPVALGQPGVAGDGCPVAPGADSGGAVAVPLPVPLPGAPTPALVPDPLAAALAAQDVRAAALRACLTEAARGIDAERRRARRLSRARRRSALRAVERRARRLRAACRQRHGRTPARVAGLTARATGGGRARLSFRAAGTDGGNPPAARSYVIKQSRAPIRNARAFSRAASLCGGTCSFDVTALGATVSLTVTDLRRGTYHYAIAAVDNVSDRIGPRSATIKVRVR